MDLSRLGFLTISLKLSPKILINLEFVLTERQYLVARNSETGAVPTSNGPVKPSLRATSPASL